MSKVSVRTECMGSLQFCCQIGDHKLPADAPEAYGGSDAAPQPADELLAAYANCFGISLALACKARDISIKGLAVEVEADHLDDEKRLDNFRVIVHLPEATPEQAERAIRSAQRVCVVGNTIIRGANAEVVLAK